MSINGFNDAEIIITTALLKMALVKRAWIGKDSNITRPLLLYANEGLSPFGCLDLNEDKVAAINQHEEALSRATSVSISNIKLHKSKFVAKVPTDGAEFILLLKRFTNLIYVLFGAECPFFKGLVSIINAFWNISRPAREAMSL